MKKISLFLLVFFIAVGMSYATEHKIKSEQMIKGTLEKIDVEGKSITVMPEKKAEAKEFTLSENANVWTKGKAVTAADLKPGEKITVYVDTATNMATKVYVEPTKMKSK